jgi:cell division control protein 6
LFESNTDTGGVLRNESYLDTGYVPDKPVGRESEVNRIVRAVKPVTHGKQGENLLVHGPAGIGKTTSVRYVFNQLENETTSKSVYINAWKYNTRPSLLTELLIQLGYPAPRKGKPVDELLSKIREWLDKNRGVAVAIDEFDQLDNQTEVIYDLQLVNEESSNPLGLVMVSNQPPRQVELDPRSHSRLNCKTLEFTPYNTPQLEQILQERVERAFQPGTVHDEVITEIAETVAENSGDCRQALQKLLQAARKAEQEGKRKLTTDLIQ